MPRPQRGSPKSMPAFSKVFSSCQHFSNYSGGNVWIPCVTQAINWLCRKHGEPRGYLLVEPSVLAEERAIPQSRKRFLGRDSPQLRLTCQTAFKEEAANRSHRSRPAGLQRGLVKVIEREIGIGGATRSLLQLRKKFHRFRTENRGEGIAPGAQYVAIRIQEDNLVRVEFHACLGCEVTGCSFARIGGPKDENRAIFYADAGSGQCRQSKTRSSHAEEDVKGRAVSESRIVLQEPIGEKGHRLTTVQIDGKKASLSDVDVADAEIRKRRERHSGGLHLRI